MFYILYFEFFKICFYLEIENLLLQNFITNLKRFSEFSQLKDDTAIRFEKEGHARPYDMKSTWTENLRGVLEIKNDKIFKESYEWN